MQGKSRESPARFRILDDKFEMNNVRFEDEGLITCHAENMFGVEVSKVNLTVLGELLLLFISKRGISWGVRDKKTI